ncbi:MAG: transcription initiation factor IIB [Candidatus Micrarchaeales archaeon]
MQTQNAMNTRDKGYRGNRKKKYYSKRKLYKFTLLKENRKIFKSICEKMGKEKKEKKERKKEKKKRVEIKIEKIEEKAPQEKEEMQIKKKKVEEEIKACPRCGSTNLVKDPEKGELICADCGLVIEENIIEFGPEWRAFDAEQREKRVRGGAPISYMRPNKGLVTEIDQYNRDIRGSKLPSKRQSQFYRMRKWHKRASVATSIERNLAIALSELDRISSYLGLPENIRNSIALLYRKCVEKGLIRGRPLETVVAAVIYAVCREEGMPRTLEEIANVSGISKKDIGRAYRFISHELDIKIPLTDPTNYVPRYVAALKLGGEVEKKAEELLKEALSKGLISGRSPTGVAAAAVYIAATLLGERRTQKEVADVAGVTEVTIRNRYRELKKALNLKVDL